MIGYIWGFQGHEMVALLGSEEAGYHHDEAFRQICQVSVRCMLSHNHDAWECKWLPLVGFGCHICTLGWYMNTLEARMPSQHDGIGSSKTTRQTALFLHGFDVACGARP